MDLAQLLNVALQKNASDIVVKVGSVPRLRVNGDLYDVENALTVNEDHMHSWISSILPVKLMEQFTRSGDADFRFTFEGKACFRVNLFRQRQALAMVLRVISTHVRKISELGLPDSLERIALRRRGLILVTGATGSGKSTTMAAMLQHINRKRRSHIVTIEDPIEFEFTDRKSSVSQREIGIDVDTFDTALRAALRQNPDVIAVGEMRDKETMGTAIKAAETGHLVFGTLHTSDAVETLTRVMSYFPPEQHQTIRMQLASSLQAIVSQRLLRKKDKSGRVAANEILVATPIVKDIVLRGETFTQLYDVMRQSKGLDDMISFDDSLLALFQTGVVSGGEALAKSSSPNDLQLRMNGIGA